MSLLSSKHVDVIIGADFYEVILHTKGLGSKVLMQRTKHFESAANDDAYAFIPALTESLAQLQLTPKTPLSIFLMSDYVQYTTLPAQAEDMSSQELHDYAKAAFEQLFGEVALDWSVAVQETPPFSPMVCAAIDSLLLSNLQTMAEQTQFKLITVAPFLNAVVDAFQKPIRSVSGYLAIVEQNRLLLLQLLHGRPASVSVDMIEGRDWEFMLMQMLTRARLTATGEQKQFKQVLVHAPLMQLSRQQRLNSEYLQGWNIQWLANTQLYALNHLPAKEAAA